MANELWAEERGSIQSCCAAIPRVVRISQSARPPNAGSRRCSLRENLRWSMEGNTSLQAAARVVFY